MCRARQCGVIAKIRAYLCVYVCACVHARVVCALTCIWVLRPWCPQDAAVSFLAHRSSSFCNLTDQHALAVGVKMYTRAHYLFPEQAKCNLLVSVCAWRVRSSLSVCVSAVLCCCCCCCCSVCVCGGGGGGGSSCHLCVIECSRACRTLQHGCA
jgi:hypothetical protein